MKIILDGWVVLPRLCQKANFRVRRSVLRRNSRSWMHMQRLVSPLEMWMQEMAPGSCTCSVCLACIRPDVECEFTGLCSCADVEPKSKCYGVSPQSVSRPSLLLVPTHFWPSTGFPTCCALLLPLNQWQGLQHPCWALPVYLFRSSND